MKVKKTVKDYVINADDNPVFYDKINVEVEFSDKDLDRSVVLDFLEEMKKRKFLDV